MAAAQQGGSLVGLILPFVLMLAFFYIIVYIPENKRKKKYKSMLDTLKVNDEIITKGGILGKVITIQDTFIVLETGPSKARIKLDKNGILSVLNTSTVSEKEAKREDKKIEASKEEAANDSINENTVEFKEN
ncbi:preprotein translocase subunit YajC [Clostridium pascui]|uniref:preprotein translocase subunit YajC n=1 Tax=Clostridium pascui TaxID=46609 RepID=UPI00195F2225|nr:preprotein translocase subunit YajC [Clostridium pascui]MBM7870131.1 preprotein translocase subunit YajC [Clostridium pascui]